LELSADRAGTLRFTVVAAGVVLGLSGSAVLPLLLPWQGQGVLTLGVVLLALLPSVGFWLVYQRRSRKVMGATSLWTWALAVSALSGLSLAPLFHLYRGQVRVLNHGDEPFALFVDGRRVARVEPSSGESALAGAWLTLPAGERELRVMGELTGRELFRAAEHVEGGSPHLFAPVSAGYCFTIEKRGYGAARDQAPESVPLGRANPFWVLPEGVAWFAGSPEPGPIETSGGTLSSLRQRRCLD
jgi:hypothetical protein